MGGAYGSVHRDPGLSPPVRHSPRDVIAKYNIDYPQEDRIWQANCCTEPESESSFRDTENFAQGCATTGDL
jgi:hypothetical protein